MGIISSIMAGRGEISISELDRMMTESAWGAPTAAGNTVSEENSLNLIPFFACVRLIANTVATLPFPTYRYTRGGGKVRDWEHPLYSVLHDSPNPEMTAYDYWAAKASHLERWGNSYSEIVRNGIGDVVQLWPLDPAMMRPDHWGEDGRLMYRYILPDGSTKWFHSSLIFHVRGFGSNGITGYGPVGLARQGIGLAKALESYGATFFGNDSRPGGVLSVEGALKKEGRDALKAAWEDAHKGMEQKHRIAVLDAGAKFQATSLPNEDAQFLESRKFQRTEIAMMCGVPPHMIGDTEPSTSWGTGIESMTTGWYVMGLRARLVMIEQRVMLDLFTPAERKTHKAEFVADGLLRGDAATRHETYQKGIQNGYYTVNDILRMENRNPIGPEGDRRFVNGAMVPIDQAGLQVRPAPSGNDARLREIVREAAARVVRKEIAAMGKAAKGYPERLDEWAVAVTEFYARHAAFVSEALRVPLGVAAQYADEQQAALHVHGPSAMDDWPYRRVDDLVRLALGGDS